MLRFIPIPFLKGTHPLRRKHTMRFRELTTTISMKKSGILYLALFLLFAAALFIWKEPTLLQDERDNHLPTEGPRFSEEDGLHFLRQAWWAEMHRTRERTDWRQLEYQTQWERYRRQRDLLTFRGEECRVDLPGDRFRGYWEERGSTNQAGSVYQTEYDPERDEIWLLSAGGSLWKGDRRGKEWTVVNQQLQFDPGLLKLVSVEGKRRLLAVLGRIPHYSEDEGRHWTPAEGIDYDDAGGRIKDVAVLNDTILYALSQPAVGQNARLHKSTDGGASFRTVSLFGVKDLDRIGLFLPFHGDRPYLALKNEDNELSLFRIHPEENVLEELPAEAPLNTGVIPVNLTGWQTDSLSRWYSYVEQNNELRLFQTNDEGAAWEDRGLLPAVPWDVGITVSPSDPELLFLGEVECYRSLNGGGSWKRINPWYAYYNDINNNLHADMMHFGEYQTTDGRTFMLISHHGGLSYSEDFFVTQRNLGKHGLNITQYYDARTSPLDPDLVFAGSQDQGLQFNLGFTDGGRSPLAQFLPGDYDHLLFTRGGQSLWAVSPGGWVVHLADAEAAQVTASWTLPNFESAVWFPPMTGLPSEEKSEVLLAGGKLDESAGAHLIRLEADGDQIRPTQLPFDFEAASDGGRLSALGVSASDGRWYAATTNGYFFSSTDQGQNWQTTRPDSENGDLFYSTAIFPSRTQSTVVYWGGSGYDQPPVYRSADGGRTFAPMSEGLPPTVVFDLAANEDESLLFAATQAGPYVYSRAEGRWFDLVAPCSPVQLYASVEYLPGQEIVRFGTFGRGIWDLKLDETVTVREPAWAPSLELFPNPTAGRLQLIFDGSHRRPIQWELWSVAGQRLQSGLVPARAVRHTLDLSTLPSGVFFLRLRDGGRVVSRQIVRY